MRPGFPVWFLVMVLSLHATDAPPMPNADNLSIPERIDALQKLMFSKPPPDPVGLEVCFQNLRVAVQKRDQGQEIDTLHNILAAGFLDKAVQEAGAALVMAIDEENRKQDDAIEAKIKELMVRATKAIQTAKTADELDGLITEMRQLAPNGVIRTPGTGFRAPGLSDGRFRTLDDICNYVVQWQDYLLAVKARDHMRAAEVAERLSNSNGVFTPLTRSDLITRSQQERAATRPGNPDAGTAIVSPPEELKDETVNLSTLADIPAAIAHIQSLQVKHPGLLNSLVNQLTALQRAKEQCNAKNYAGAIQLLNQEGDQRLDPALPWSARALDDVSRLKNQLRVQVVQGLIDKPDVAPAKDEGAVDFLLRVASAESKGSDWPGLFRTLEAYQMITPANGQGWLQEDINSIQSYLIGLKMEKAGQTLDAMRCYRQALASVGRYFSGDAAGEHLEALKKSSPDIYKQLMEQPVSVGGLRRPPATIEESVHPPL